MPTMFASCHVCIAHLCMCRGVFKKICTGMLKVEFKILTISIPRKAWFCDPSLYHFSAKKHSIWGKLGAFLAKFSKKHPILQIGLIGYVTITHPSIYQNLRKCTSKPLSIPVHHLSVRTPSPGHIICTKVHTVGIKNLLLLGNCCFTLSTKWEVINCLCHEGKVCPLTYLQSKLHNNMCVGLAACCGYKASTFGSLW